MLTTRAFILALVSIQFVFFLPPVRAEEPKAKAEDIEAARSEMLKRWGVSGLVKPAEIDAIAKPLLARPLPEQPNEELLALAKKANAAANFVGFILEDYDQYYRENFRYDFVQTKIAPFHDAYVALSNRMKDYRNQAYFNLGKKASDRGDAMAAFFFFRDAYRLSAFTQDEGDHKGMRYQAEIEMKKLLGIDGMGTFAYWK